ncbi:hypothetical protein ACFL02_00805 [Planctomycetota bacterium]
MPRNFIAIVTNTFTETLRQPIYGVVIAATIILLVISPSLIMFTLEDDNLLLKDIGLSTLLVAGLLLGVFAAAAVVTEEIENKTTITVISKTVRRSLFIMGKFVGIAAAVVLAEYILSLVLLMVVRHGVLQMGRDRHDMVVISLGLSAAGLTFVLGLAGNYFYRWRFSSFAILMGAALATVVMALLTFIDPNWNYDPAQNLISWELIGPIVLIIIAVLILTAIAVAASTRLSMTMSLVICITVFILGIMLEHWLGPIAHQPSGFLSYLAWIPLTVIPSISFFVVTNVIYQETVVPASYIAQIALYAFLYVGACLLFAIALFRTREIG